MLFMVIPGDGAVAGSPGLSAMHARWQRHTAPCCLFERIDQIMIESETVCVGLPFLTLVLAKHSTTFVYFRPYLCRCLGTRT